MKRFPQFRGWWAFGIALGLCAVAQAQFLPTYRPGQKYRSLNTDVYDISIQKNGRLDVVLTTGEPVFENAFPMIWFGDEDEPEALAIDGRWSARSPVDDPLGEGQGMLIHHKQTDWSLRAYPTKPYMAVQAAYTNTGKRPVTVRALLPWCVGAPKKGALRLGPGTEKTVFLSNGPGFIPALSTEQAESDTYLAAVNRTNRRSLIAGFLTQDRSATRIEVGNATIEEGGAFRVMRAACVYDPPIVVQPGDRLESEVFYLAIGESSPLAGLERYARAAAVINHARREGTAPPTGWYFGDGWTQASISARLDALGFSTLDGSWRHVVVGLPDATVWDNSDAWRRLRDLADTLHTGGYTVGVTIPLFRLPEENGILDPLIPGATGAFTAAVANFASATNVDAMYDTSGEGYETNDFPNPGIAAERAHTAFAAARAGLPANVFFASSAAGLSAIGAINGRWYGPADPIQWEGNPFKGGLGVSDSLCAEAQQFCLSPHWWRRVRVIPPDSEFPLGDTAWRTWVTGATMLGDALLVDLSRGGAVNTAFLDGMTPPLRSALPLDLFDTAAPALWVQGLEKNDTLVTALFNWDATANATGVMPLVAAGLGAGNLYSVYEPIPRAYHGTARGVLSADIPARGVRLFQLAPHREIPVVVDSSARTIGVLPYRGDDALTQGEGTLAFRLPEGAGGDAFIAIVLPEGVQAAAEPEATYTLSPDGRMIVVRGPAGQAVTLALTGE